MSCQLISVYIKAIDSDSCVSLKKATNYINVICLKAVLLDIFNVAYICKEECSNNLVLY
jgi:hypothetical protein